MTFNKIIPSSVGADLSRFGSIYRPSVDFLLQIDGVTFGYDRQPLLYDLHMQLHEGEMVGLLGPNGSGKTTLLRLISGVLRPQQGKILLEGRDLKDWGRRGVAQRIAVVPQELHMPFAFTVEQMVNLGRTPFATWFGSTSRNDSLVVQDAMQAADITPLALRIFNELSGGERQRVMLAMALAQQPKLLLLDEPTSHLDIKYQFDMLELVQQLNRERGVTVIAAMHDLNLAARYFPRLVLFQRGIVADAGPAEVLEPGLLKRVYGVNVQVGILRGAEHLSVLPPSASSPTNQPPVGPDRIMVGAPLAGAQGVGAQDAGTLSGGQVTLDASAQGAGAQGAGALDASTPGAVAPDAAAPGHPQVHVMAGGGSGELMMRALADAHIPFIAGALNIGDSDHTLALRLAHEVITEQPYAPISPAILEQVHISLERVALLILCPMPIGPGNLSLLQETLSAKLHREGNLRVLQLAPAGTDTAHTLNEPVFTHDNPLFPPVGADLSRPAPSAELAERVSIPRPPHEELLKRTAIAARDYTGGEGVRLISELLQAGAIVVETLGGAVAEAIEAVEAIEAARKSAILADMNE